MKREQVETFVEKLVLEKIANTKLELVDVEYVREREWYLRVFLDKEGGLDIEDCQLVSQLIAEELEEKDPIREKYYLEVSSPGLDRQLKKDRDYIRHKDSAVDIQFFKVQDGRKTFVAILKDFTLDNFILEENGQELIIAKNLVASMRLHLEF